MIVFLFKINHPLPQINSLAAFNVSNKLLKSERKREQRLERLAIKESSTKKREERIKSHYLGIYVLDLSSALNAKPTVTWLPPRNLDNGPEETVFYSLLTGKSELVMFGGIRKDSVTLDSVDISNQISNSLHFISAPNYVI